MESGEEVTNGPHAPGMSHLTGEMILGDEVSHWRLTGKMKKTEGCC